MVLGEVPTQGTAYPRSGRAAPGRHPGSWSSCGSDWRLTLGDRMSSYIVKIVHHVISASSLSTLSSKAFFIRWPGKQNGNKRLFSFQVWLHPVLPKFPFQGVLNFCCYQHQHLQLFLSIFLPRNKAMIWNYLLPWGKNYCNQKRNKFSVELNGLKMYCLYGVRNEITICKCKFYGAVEISRDLCDGLELVKNIFS